MKYTCVFLSMLIFFCVVSCKEREQPTTGGEYNIHNPASASKSKDAKKASAIDFERTEYNFGTLIQGEKVSYAFNFTNTGGGNLIISDVGASCGCTVPKWTREAILPGETGKIEIIFDSRGRSGKQMETIHVYSNTQPNVTELIIRCDIIN